jgi:hypothetical protein
VPRRNPLLLVVAEPKQTLQSHLGVGGVQEEAATRPLWTTPHFGGPSDISRLLFTGAPTAAKPGTQIGQERRFAALPATQMGQ